MKQTDAQPMGNHIFQASVDASGRVLLPAELRRDMDVEAGSVLIWVRDDAGLHLKSFEDSLAEIQAYYQSLSPAEQCWSDELIVNRRKEAAHE